jgi:hypothetical protein
VAQSRSSELVGAATETLEKRASAVKKVTVGLKYMLERDQPGSSDLEGFDRSATAPGAW